MDLVREENSVLDQEVRRYRVSQAYLEMASAFLHAEVVRGEDQKSKEMPNELIYALCASNFQNAYLAVSSFLIAQITSCYRGSPKFRESFKADDLESVFRKELQDLPQMLKAASRGLQVENLHAKRPSLHQKLNELVKQHRHFLTHPNPIDFHEKLSKITEKIQWGFPVDVARDVIQYFFEETNTPLPQWLLPESRLFRIPRIEVFDAIDAQPEKALFQQPGRYRRNVNNGEVSDFQYDHNNGLFVLGDAQCSVTLKVTEAGDNSIHVYNDKCKSVRIAEGASTIDEISDPRSFDGSSRTRTAATGDVVLWENDQGSFFAIRLTDVKYPYISFDYKLIEEDHEWAN